MITNYKIYGSLREFSNEQLISYLHNNMETEFGLMTSVLSEILRRLDEKSPLFPNVKEDKENEDWGNPLTP